MNKTICQSTVTWRHVTWPDVTWRTWRDVTWRAFWLVHSIFENKRKTITSSLHCSLNWPIVLKTIAFCLSCAVIGYLPKGQPILLRTFLPSLFPYYFHITVFCSRQRSTVLVRKIKSCVCNIGGLRFYQLVIEKREAPQSNTFGLGHEAKRDRFLT